MRLLLLGATGPTGLQLVGQALDQGHHVTALVRSPEKLPRVDGRLTVLVGDVADEQELATAAVGQDAVLSTMGTGRSLTSDIVSRTVDALVPAMHDAGVDRLIFLSAFGVNETYAQASLPQRFFYRTMLRKIYPDKGKADRKLLAADLDVTLVYPVTLTNRPFTGTYRVGDHFEFRGMPKISRADVAHFMLTQLTDPTWSRRTAILTN
ncbi:NAD(P)-dependent oxidoreductase [Streptomyces sp. NBC_01481]|uniref:NAD(P)-dependent oxidoreductase n=1 Tax=Streptomyces sp. NBC_01481 TaxID=2975869 RepID=UPI0022575FBE|nr:NAD(P)-binding oxidoreductase [Streptomyces sp. NBC_01481]MCX4587256.1 SDR family oxidoreductase [Streptomyces sp. NBC_01481]